MHTPVEASGRRQLLSLIPLSYLIFKDLFICVYEGFACIYICAPPYESMGPLEVGKDTQCSVTGVADGCKLSCGNWAPNLGSLQEQQVFLTTEGCSCLDPTPSLNTGIMEVQATVHGFYVGAENSISGCFTQGTQTPRNKLPPWKRHWLWKGGTAPWPESGHFQDPFSLVWASQARGRWKSTAYIPCPVAVCSSLTCAAGLPSRRGEDDVQGR